MNEEDSRMKKQHVVAMTMVSVFAGCAAFELGTVPAAPDNLRPAASEVLSMGVQATGVQIYECNAAKDAPAKFEWIFKAPEAELFDRTGYRIGKHYAGPTWESNDGSKVVGEVKAQDNGPDVDAIPWLLLGAKSNSGKWRRQTTRRCGSPCGGRCT